MPDTKPVAGSRFTWLLLLQDLVDLSVKKSSRICSNFTNKRREFLAQETSGGGTKDELIDKGKIDRQMKG
jgi:hypothetical protein